MIPVFLIAALAVENLLFNLRERLSKNWQTWFSWGIVLILAAVSLRENARLVFEDYYQQFRNNAWNTSEIGGVIRFFSDTVGEQDQAWVVPYPRWVDTRLVGIQAVGEVRDYALWPDQIADTVEAPTPKVYLYKPEDEEAIRVLRDLYPDGIVQRYDSAVEGRDFMLYYVLDGRMEQSE